MNAPILFLAAASISLSPNIHADAAAKTSGSQKNNQYISFTPQTDVTPSARGCPKANGPYVTGSFIYWKSQLEDPDVFAVLYSNSTLKLKGPSYEYSPGFKLGLGYNVPRDSWDVFLNWTWLKSEESHHFKSTSSAEVHPTFYSQNDEPTPISGRNAIQWNLSFNVLDFELGRNFFISRHLSLRPFAGFKTAWVDPKIGLSVKNVFNAAGPKPDLNASLKTENFGIGPRMGLNTRWNLTSLNFAFIANAAASLLWQEMEQREPFNQSGNLKGIFKADRNYATAVTEMFVGFDWGKCCWDWFNVNLSAGYEIQVWWSQFDYFLFTEFHNKQNLSFNGLTASVRFDF